MLKSMVRLVALALVWLVVAACTAGEGAAPGGTRGVDGTQVGGEVTVAAPVIPVPTATPTPSPSASPTPSPSPTVSPTPVPILHPAPWVIAIEAGHGGPYYWGGSARDGDGNQWIEKDVVLDIALRLYERLLADEEGRYLPVLVRSGDYTLTEFWAGDYRGSLIAEAQARVDMANSLNADVYLAVHTNGWRDASQAGTETYCNPDRSFGEESCSLAWWVQDALVRNIRGDGYEVRDRGVRNDSDVGGDPANAHSFALGTNANFNPSLMPGVISEVLFLSSPQDLEYLRTVDALDTIAGAYEEALDNYFIWLGVSPER